MARDEELLNDFLGTLEHLKRIENKVANNLGREGIFSFPDQHKIYEGLLLSAWTHWEEFIQRLLIHDLSTDPNGFVLKDIRQFRVQGAPRRIAERILLHPDHPERFVEWDYSRVTSRANQLLSEDHRFSRQLERRVDLDKIRRIRNAIAHKSDRARTGFLRLVRGDPFFLGRNQLRGITVGRFLAAHEWNDTRVLTEAVEVLAECAEDLVL